jgi:acylphosphatase
LKSYRCISGHVEDLADGRVVAPGEEVKLTAEQIDDPHNARLIDENKLSPIEDPGSKKLTGDALQKEAERLGIEGRTEMRADALREAVAEAQAKEQEGGDS